MANSSNTSPMSGMVDAIPKPNVKPIRLDSIIAIKLLFTIHKKLDVNLELKFHIS
ncbi:MAG: hypothetical protein ACFFFY_06125 [Promethearchaeota archaeon]